MPAIAPFRKVMPYRPYRPISQAATPTTAGHEAGKAGDPNQPPQLNIPVTDMTAAQIERKLIKARIDMLMDAPFFGNLATRLILRDATDWPSGQIQTAGTDGKYFYYNRNFVAAISDQETVFLMGHEVMHCVYDHMDGNRRGDRIPVLWNIANDYVINWELVESKIGTKITLIDICYNSKFRDMTSENVYDLLYDEAKKNGGNGTGEIGRAHV